MDSSSKDRPVEISVSIVNYRTPELTIQCMRSVLDDMAGIDGCVVVVDNGSNDGSAEAIEAWIAAQGPDVPAILVRSGKNSGFSGGHNQGLAARRAEFYLLLNSDSVLRRGFVSRMLQAARAAPPEAGLFTPRLEFDDGTPQISHFRFPTPFSELIRGAATGGITSLLARWDIPLGEQPEPDRIEWASFACILLRHATVEALGPLDEGYFLYFEDSEYCLRARRAGWRILHVPEARAVHHRGGSAPVKRLAAARRRLPAYYYASRTRFLYQAYGTAGLLTANLLWYAGRGVAQLRRLAGKPVPRAVEAETRDIWTNFLTPLGDRRATGS
jgi:N-acetylglucosaminyl-diphospho-decaprenol L-rhamnosyltransferase